MSRVANSPVTLPSGVEVKLNGQDFSVKGSKGEMAFVIHDSVLLVQEESELKIRAKGEDKDARAMAGTMRALVQNMHGWGQRIQCAEHPACFQLVMRMIERPRGESCVVAKHATTHNSHP